MGLHELKIMYEKFIFSCNTYWWAISFNERLVTRDGQTDGRDYEITSCLINY